MPVVSENLNVQGAIVDLLVGVSLALAARKGFHPPRFWKRIGIVAAVLGVIVTMGHMNAPPAVIGAIVDALKDYGVVEGRCNREAVGAVLGGVAGGAVGSQVGRGSGRDIAILAGTAASVGSMARSSSPYLTMAAGSLFFSATLKSSS